MFALSATTLNLAVILVQCAQCIISLNPISVQKGEPMGLMGPTFVVATHMPTRKVYACVTRSGARKSLKVKYFLI